MGLPSSQSSSQRVCTARAADIADRAASARCSGDGAWSTPSMSSSPSARAGARSARVAALVPDDQLAEQRIVERRHRVAGIEHACRSARPVPPGTEARSPCPGAGAKSCAGSSALIRHSIAWPARRMSSWRKRRAFAAGDADHLAHEVDAGDHLGDGMLDLDARVHLDEEEFAARLVVEIFERAGAAIADRLRERDRGGAERSRASPAGGRRQALPPRLSGAGAAASIRARSRWMTFSPSPSTCTSTWRARCDEAFSR